MNFLLQLVRKYPLTVLCLAAIWYLSFFTPPQTELDHVDFIDKWVHIIMYGGTCMVMWVEYLHRHRQVQQWGKLIFFSWLAPILMSGLIELLQAYCTGGRRSGGWLDLAANAIGVTLAAVIGIIVANLRK